MIVVAWLLLLFIAIYGGARIIDVALVRGGAWLREVLARRQFVASTPFIRETRQRQAEYLERDVRDMRWWGR